jgi:hypothetical protein
MCVRIIILWIAETVRCGADLDLPVEIRLTVLGFWILLRKIMPTSLIWLCYSRPTCYWMAVALSRCATLDCHDRCHRSILTSRETQTSRNMWLQDGIVLQRYFWPHIGMSPHYWDSDHFNCHVLEHFILLIFETLWHNTFSLQQLSLSVDLCSKVSRKSALRYIKWRFQ